ncbi:hypothetical protein ACQ4PT_023140 [Festuca glaucescens]
MASGSDDLGEVGVGPETLRVHDWVPEGMELRFAFLVNIRRDRYIVDAKKKKKFQGVFDYPLPMDYEANIDASVIDDEEGEDEDLPPVQWDPENPQMEEGSIFASMSECRNALVTYCIKEKRTFEVDKSNTVYYRVHCPTDDCPWRMHTSKMRNSTNIQVKVNPFRHICLESTLRKETISRAKSRWVAEEVKRWVTENHQVGTKELQKNLKEKFKIELPYMRVFNGKQHAMESIYGQAGNIQQYVHEYYSVARFKATYAHALPALEGKQQWDIVDPDFKLCAPVLKRPAVDPAFGGCFDDENDGQQPLAPDDENDAHQPHDFANDPNDDSDDDQIEAPNDDQIDYQSDQNVEQNDAPIEAPNDGDQNVEQNDAPIEAPKDGEQNVEQNDAPTEAPNDACSVVGSNKVVVVSSEVLEVPTTKRRRVE